MSDHIDILKELEALSNTSKNVYVPSLKREVSIKPLTLKQQKDIIKLAADNITSVISFNMIIYQILKENLVGVKVNDLTVIDRSCLCVAMRYLFVNKKISLQEDGKKSDVNLSEVIKNFPNVDCEIDDEVIAVDNFEFHVSLPDLATDNEFNKKLKAKFKDISTKEEIKDLFGDLYVHELGKFITKITIKKDEEDVEIDFATLPIQKRVQTIESIPTDVYSEIIKFTSKGKDAENELLTTKVEDADYTIEVGSELFTP